MTSALLEAPPDNMDMMQAPASPSMGAPSSPALSREQIKSRSTRGWSGSSNQNPATTTAGVFAPLSFRAKQQQSSSVAMQANPSSDSTMSSSSLDTGSPFEAIIDKFDMPPRDNVRKSSASFKVLDKKAVSNSPFLANAVSASPTSTTRKPFAPVDPCSNNNSTFRQSQSQWSGSVPSSPARHGLGLLSKSTPNSQQGSPVATTHSFISRIPHRRQNSDVENLNPAAIHQQHLAPAKQQQSEILSPATRFNEEMQMIGAPPAREVTSGTGTIPGLPTPDLGRDFGADSPDVAESPSTAFKARKGRPSVTSLGNRGTVSSSPFLQQQQNGGQPTSSVPMSHRQTSSISSVNSFHSMPNSPFSHTSHIESSETASPQASSMSLPRRGSKQMLGPRAPSYTDLHSQAQLETVEHLADEYDEDQPIQNLTEANLERKASKKSVKWAEVEEVCEYDVETEDGESRRSSAASSNSLNMDDGQYTDDEEELSARHPTPAYEAYEQEDEEYYDNYRHSSAEPEPIQQEQEEYTIHASTPRSGGHLTRDVSIMSEAASIIEKQPDNSLSSYDGEDEVRSLIDRIDSATLETTSSKTNDFFSKDFGFIRTPHSSAGSSSLASELSTPQALNFAGSASRRPLPPPPVAVLAASPGSSADQTQDGTPTMQPMFLKTEDSQYSLMDMDFSSSPLLSSEEMRLARKESVKRASVLMMEKKTEVKVQSIKEEVIDNTPDTTEMGGLERSISPRPRLTAEEVMSSLRKKPGNKLASLSQSQPLASTPPNGSIITTPSDLPDVSTGSNKIARSGPSKAISARPAPPPVKISSEQLPTLRTGTPSPLPPSPIKARPSPSSSEPESALDRLMRETRDADSLQAPSMGRARSNSSSSGHSTTTYETADTDVSNGKPLQYKGIEHMQQAALRKGDLPTRPSGRRRSLSTGDANLEELKDGSKAEVARASTPLGTSTRPQTAPQSASKLQAPLQLQGDPFGPGIGQALNSVIDDYERGYRVREQFRGSVAYAKPEDGKVSTIGSAGDVDSGKAWKKIKRPSDLHEHRSHIREYKQTSATRKEKRAGSLFVKVGKLFLSNSLPIPSQPTYIACTLANHKNLVQTPYAKIVSEKSVNAVNIASEFELVADEKLEMTLSFKIRKDSHLQPPRIQQQPQQVAPASPTRPRHMHSNSASGGFRAGLQKLLGSPRKNKDRLDSRPSSRLDMAPSPMPPMQNTYAPPPILEYVNNKDHIATYHLKASDILSDCLGTKLVKLYACQPALGAKRGMKDIGMVELHLFYIPPMPDIPISELPQSIEECLTGLKEVERYDKSFFEGVLTQQGADCKVPRRRTLRLKGSRLIAFNEVTHKAHAVIDLSIATRVEDPDEPDLPPTPSTAMSSKGGPATPNTVTTATTAHRRTRSMDDEDDPFSARPHAFKLIFEDEGTIDFFADNAADKTRWVAALRSVVGKSKRSTSVPPLWAQTLHAANKERQRVSDANKK